MKRKIIWPILAVLITATTAYAASWKTTDTEDSSVNGGEIVMVENEGGIDNNWMSLTTIKTWVLNALSAASVAVVDAGTYFTGTDVEAVLQEVGASLGDKLDAGDVVTVSTDVETMLGSANNAAILSNIGAQASDADLTDLADGTLTASKVGGAKVTTASKAADYTIGTDSADEAYGGTIYVTSAATVTAPAVAAGMNFTVVTIGAIAVSLDVNASDRMYLDGTALSDGDKATNTSTTGDTITCQYESSAGFFCWSGSPDGDHWTDGN